MSEFGKWVAGGGSRPRGLGRVRELRRRAPGLPGTYGFKIKPEQLIVLSGGDTAATIKAAADKTNGANAAMVYGTDGGIAPSGLIVLADDKNVQPVYAPAPIIREAVLKENPKIADILKPIFQVPRPHDAAGPERACAGRRRGGEVRRHRLSEVERLREIAREATAVTGAERRICQGGLDPCAFRRAPPSASASVEHHAGRSIASARLAVRRSWRWPCSPHPSSRTGPTASSPASRVRCSRLCRHGRWRASLLV